MHIYEFLREVESGQLIEVYTCRKSILSFLLGEIESLSEKQLVLAQLDRFGKDDGTVTIRMKDIIKVAHSTQYADLVSFCRSNRNVAKKTPRANGIGGDKFYQQLRVAHKKQEPVNIYAESGGEEAEIVGFVEDLNKEWVKLRELASTGLDDGYSMLCLATVTRITRNSRDERVLAAYNASRKHSD